MFYSINGTKHLLYFQIKKQTRDNVPTLLCNGDISIGSQNA
jgi:hypothetical protein